MDRTPAREVDLIERLARVRLDLAFGQNYERREGREGDVLVYKKEVVRFRKMPMPARDLFEQALLQKLAAKGAPVPQTKFISPDGTMSIQTRMPGLVLVPEDNPFPGTVKISQLTDMQLDQLGIQIADFLADMHGQSKPRSINTDLEITAHRVQEAKETLAAFIEKFPAAPQSDSLRQIITAPIDSYIVTLHGDLGYGNIIVDISPITQAGFIDFGCVRTGPASYDFANIAAMSPRLYKSALRHYNQKMSANIDVRQPLLYRAASYAASLLDNTAHPDIKARAAEGLEKIAACLANTQQNTKPTICKNLPSL